MNNICFYGGTAVLPDRLLDDAVVVCRGGKITYVGKSKKRIPNPKAAENKPGTTLVDLKGGYLFPGFIDIHIHGGGGADVMDGTVAAVQKVCQSHARHGTTTLFPTTSTGTDSQIHAMIDSCVAAKSKWMPKLGSRIGGVHLYGPYFSKDKAGCHSTQACRSPKPREFKRYFESGIIKVATCAAELNGSGSFFRYAKNQKCLVTCGHSNASWNEMEKAFKSGMRHVDHFWCAMSNVSSVRKRLGVPMQGSMLEFVLANPDMSTEVIADGMHLAPELLRFAWQAKTVKRLCLVTDCNRALDMPPGRYRFGPKSNGSWFKSDGKVGWASSGALASSVMGMDHMVKTMHKLAGVPLVDTVRTATLTPAERIGIDSETGSLAKGKAADVLVVSKSLSVKATYLGGERFRAS